VPNLYENSYSEGNKEYGCAVRAFYYMDDTRRTEVN
jgi:hypothetical protein